MKTAAKNLNHDLELMSAAEKGNFDVFTSADRENFTEKHKQSPEEYKQKCDDQKVDKLITKTLKKHEKLIQIDNMALRQDIDGYYYFGSRFDPKASKYYLVGFEWGGSRYETTATTTTTGNNKQQGRLGSTIVGGMLLGPVGAIAGASRGKKTKVNQTSITTSKDGKEIKTKGICIFISKDTKKRETKFVMCDSSLAEKIYKLDFVPEQIAYNENPEGIADQIAELKSAYDNREMTREEFEQKLGGLI